MHMRMHVCICIYIYICMHARFEQFSEVHNIRRMSGHEAWRKFLDMIGFPELDIEAHLALQGYAFLGFRVYLKSRV